MGILEITFREQENMADYFQGKGEHGPPPPASFLREGFWVIRSIVQHSSLPIEIGSLWNQDGQ